MKEVVLGIWLGIQGGLDWKYKAIPLWLSILGGMAGICFCVIEPREVKDIVIACIPGMIALVLSKLTNEVIGYGDGITFLVMGVYLPLEKIIAVLMSAFVIAGMVALVLLVVFGKKGRERIAFLPFLMVAYYMNLWVN